MKIDPIITEQDWAFAKKNPVLGPHYQTAHRISDAAMATFEVETIKPLVDKAVSDFSGKLWDLVRDSLIDDTQQNIQGQCWRMVDEIVTALLSGNEWAVERYALQDRYDIQKTRTVLAESIKEHLQNACYVDALRELKDAHIEIERLKARERY